MEITKIFFYSSIPMALISIIFFVYENIDISDFKDDIRSECKEFFEYNLTHLIILLTSIIVFLAYLCCSSCCAIVLYIFNVLVIGGQLVEKYYNNEEWCNANCKTNCTELVELSEKTNICLISNGSIIIIVILAVLCKIINKIFC